MCYECIFKYEEILINVWKLYIFVTNMYHDPVHSEYIRKLLSSPIATAEKDKQKW